MKCLAVDKELIEMTQLAADSDGDVQSVYDIVSRPEYIKSWLDAMRCFNKSVLTHAGPVYTVPLLTPELCDFLVQVAAEAHFSVNAEEEVPYQIQESVLRDTAPELYSDIVDRISAGLEAWMLLAYQTVIKEIQSIQLARYTPDSTAGTGWHHDGDSDVTFVVSLNPDDFKGGGTNIRTTCTTEEHIPALPKGNALMFPGKHVWHRGAPVTEGTRYLLVIWLKI